MGKKILVIGSLNMDMVIPIKRMPMVGETVLGQGLFYIPGGKGANQACAVGRLGGTIKMLGCVGQDNFGHIQCQALAECQVDVSYLKKSKEQPTGTAVIYVNQEGNNSIVVIQGANQECDLNYLKEQDILLKESEYVLLQMEVPSQSVYYAIERAKELGKIVILNPAPAPEYIPDELLPKIDYITPNETELIKLSGYTNINMESIKSGARKLIEKGVGNVIVTLGENGCLMVNANGIRKYPARKVQAIDATAAGDCFNGAFVVGLAEGKSEEEAIVFANVAASIAVRRKGAQISIPTREETDIILNQLSQTHI